MKKNLKIFFSILLVLILLGLTFFMVDTVRVQSGENPIFTFIHKLIPPLLLNKGEKIRGLFCDWVVLYEKPPLILNYKMLKSLDTQGITTQS